VKVDTHFLDIGKLRQLRERIPEVIPFILGAGCAATLDLVQVDWLVKAG